MDTIIRQLRWYSIPSASPLTEISEWIGLKCVLHFHLMLLQPGRTCPFIPLAVWILCGWKLQVSKLSFCKAAGQLTLEVIFLNLKEMAYKLLA